MRWTRIDTMPRHQWFGKQGWVQDLSDVHGFWRACIRLPNSTSFTIQDFRDEASAKRAVEANKQED